MRLSSHFTMLGCGSSDATTLWNTNALLTTPSGNLLIDCGYTIKYALQEQGMSFSNIDAIFITHIHGDHVFGLERLAFESRFSKQGRKTIFLPRALYDDLWHHTLKGSLGLVDGCEQSLSDYFDVVLVDEQFHFHTHTVQLIDVPHIKDKNAYGIVIDDYLFYSGDTLPIPEVVNNLTFEVGFHDAQLGGYNPVHSCFDELRVLYSENVCKKLYLMGYEDGWQSHEEKVDSVFAGVAKQGMTVSIETLSIAAAGR